MMASEVYGYGRISPSGYDSLVSENMGNKNPTFQVSNQEPSGKTVGGLSVGHHALGWNNPLFWLLVLVLIVTGYIGLGFDFSVKRIGEVRGKI